MQRGLAVVRVPVCQQPALAKVLLQRLEVAEFCRVKKIGRRDRLAGT